MYKIFMSLSILPRLWCGTVIFIVGHAAHSSARHKKHYNSISSQSLLIGEVSRRRRDGEVFLPSAALFQRALTKRSFPLQRSSKEHRRRGFHLFFVSGGKQSRGREMPGRIFPAALFRYGVVAPAAQRIAPGDAPRRQQQPLTQPWVRMASMPYWLQEGEKRQFRPSPG